MIAVNKHGMQIEFKIVKFISYAIENHSVCEFMVNKQTPRANVFYLYIDGPKTTSKHLFRFIYEIEVRLII